MSAQRRSLSACAAAALLAGIAGAQDAGATLPPPPDLGRWVAVLAGMAVLPFLLTMITPFAKLVVVGGMLRQALGTPQIPPTSVITGLALVLTLHITRPVAVDVWNGYQTLQASEPDTDEVELFARAAHEPLLAFLARHTNAENLALFRELRERMERANPPVHSAPRPGDADEQAKLRRAVDAALEIATVYAPAFVLTELSEAFLIAFWLFVPFLVIDLVVGQVLLAMGMHMLQPTTIALPLKVLVFVFVGGWRLFFSGVVSGYAS